MDKWQSQQEFWGSFSVPAYDELTTLEDEPTYMHITYQAVAGVMDQTAVVSASIWDYSMSWDAISQKAEEILHALSGGRIIKVDGGYAWFRLPEGTPFAQRMDSGAENSKRIYLSVEVEFLTAG